jgi:predicted kinase
MYTRIDTQIRTYHHAPMPTRVKRTYNLRSSTVRAVREMAESYRVAGSQDAVIELAIDELQRRLRDAQESVTWEGAAQDPEFVAEARDLEDAYRTADQETWPL